MAALASFCMSCIARETLSASW
uniref:Uncharacterized protein n=1 Tax=Arundo donax TaxID=35708 RepID=A0A0A9BKF6_ARUDO